MMSIVNEKIKKVGPTLCKLEDTHQICLVLLKNTNDHALIFRAKKYGLEPTWLMYGPNGYEEQPTSLLDKTMMNLTVEDNGKLNFPFTITKDCYLQFDSKSCPVVVSDIEGIPSRVDVVYVEVEPSKMEQTNLYLVGKSMDHGKSVYEILKVDLSWVPVTFLK
jgi:hypothetical protein